MVTLYYYMLFKLKQITIFLNCELFKVDPTQCLK